MLAKLHYHLAQKLMLLLQKRRPNDNIQEVIQGMTFFATHYSSKTGEKKDPSERSKFSSQELAFQGRKLHMPLYNSSKKN